MPLIRVKSALCKNGRTELALTQGEFTRYRKGKAPLHWHVPVIAKIADGKESRAIVSGGKGIMTVDVCGPLVVNAGQSGYYRVLYNDAELTTLKSNCNKLATIDQLGLIADNFALAYADNQPIAKALDLLASVPQDAEPKLLDAVADNLYSLHSTFADHPALRTKIAAYSSTRLEPALPRLRLNTVPGKSSEAALLRTDLLHHPRRVGDSTDPANPPAPL